MDFALKSGDKFACVAFENLNVEDSLLKPVFLGDGLWTLPKHPFNLGKHWREWIGKIRVDQVDRCNFFLLAVKASTRQEILDDENDMLRKRLNRFMYGLLMQGIPDHVDGFALNGARVSDETQIRQFGELRDYYNSDPPHRVKISEAACRKAKNFEDLYKIIEESPVYIRVKRGMIALTRGISQPSIQERIHEYVRAMEALVKPAIGRSTAEFTHRCQTFAGASAEAKDVLEECYQIRSAVEHMNSLDDALTNLSHEERVSIAGKRLRQIESLAFDVYSRIVTSPSLSVLFETEASIVSFWSRKDHERREAWGNPFDICSVP